MAPAAAAVGATPADATVLVSAAAVAAASAAAAATGKRGHIVFVLAPALALGQSAVACYCLLLEGHPARALFAAVA